MGNLRRRWRIRLVGYNNKMDINNNWTWGRKFTHSSKNLLISSTKYAKKWLVIG